MAENTAGNDAQACAEILAQTGGDLLRGGGQQISGIKRLERANDVLFETLHQVRQRADKGASLGHEERHEDVAH